MYSFPDLEPVWFSMSSSNCFFLTCIQISQEAGQLVWYSYLIKIFHSSLSVLHTLTYHMLTIFYWSSSDHFPYFRNKGLKSRVYGNLWRRIWTPNIWFHVTLYTYLFGLSLLKIYQILTTIVVLIDTSTSHVWKFMILHIFIYSWYFQTFYKFDLV